MIFLAVFADYLPFVDSYSAGSVLDGKLPPSLDHWMGTDVNGRDIFSRWVYGARVSLAIGGRGDHVRTHHRRPPRPPRRLQAQAHRHVHRDDHGHPAGVPGAGARVDARDVRAGARRRRPHVSIGPIHYTLSRLWLVIFVLGVLSIPPLTRIVRASTLSFANASSCSRRVALGAKTSRVIEPRDPAQRRPGDALVRAHRPRGADRRRGRARLPRPVASARRPHVGHMIFEGKNPLQTGHGGSRCSRRSIMFLTILAINMLGDVAAKRFDIREAVG